MSSETYSSCPIEESVFRWENSPTGQDGYVPELINKSLTSFLRAGVHSENRTSRRSTLSRPQNSSPGASFETILRGKRSYSNGIDSLGP